MSDDALKTLAAEAGISLRWEDAFGEHHEVSPDSLRQILSALSLPCGSTAQIAESRRRLEEERRGLKLPPLLTARSGEATALPGGNLLAGRPYRLVQEDGERMEGRLPGEEGAVRLPPVAATGYHRLEIGDEVLTLAVAPGRCVLPADLTGDSRRLWGLAVQLYSLRRAGDGGIGDFTALAELARQAGGRGAAFLAISPLHALFAADPYRFSPYSPSSRLFLNALHADPAKALGPEAFARAVAEEGLAERLAQMEAAPDVDWPGVADCKHRLLRRLFLEQPAHAEVGRAFGAFRAERGEALEDHARYEAIQSHLMAQDTRHGSWKNWPEALRDPRGEAVAAFAAEHPHEVAYHAFLQWLAEQGGREAQAAARAAGMPIGLVADLAIGIDGGGSQGWSRQQEMLLGLSAGAPPDHFNALGQAWGITAFDPRALTTGGYKAFLETLRANLRFAGGLRIDHAMGVHRLWVVPDGADATKGAYIAYPERDLLRLTALESARHGAVIVGEDLGTVPSGFRDVIAGAGMLGMRVMWFEREGSAFRPPSGWSDKVMAMPTTHDLPTVAGWWGGRDIEWRVKLDLLGERSDEGREWWVRGEDRTRLWSAFQAAGVAEGPEPPPGEGARVVAPAAAFVGRTPSPLAVLPMEDVLAQSEQPNLPGTVDSHPNWRRRLPLTVDVCLDDPGAVERLAALDRARRE